MRKMMGWKTRGMNQDLSVSAFNPEFSFENRNLRLSTNEGNTAMSWVNERGTLELSDLKIYNSLRDYLNRNIEGQAAPTPMNTIMGTCIGTAVINNKLVLFTVKNTIIETKRVDVETEEVTVVKKQSQTDYIYVLEYDDHEQTQLTGFVAYSGYLGFNIANPLETQVSYESSDCQKVYWTDGINQVRLINIADSPKEEAVARMEKWRDKTEAYPKVNTFFDFVPTLGMEEEVTVKKVLGGGGMFAPGVIQYSFTYYNKYGQESNIFYTTPLCYISFADRGASPEEKVDNAFVIQVKNLDMRFDYLRIYSIQRTSINGTPICKRIQDIKIDESLDPIDKNDLTKGYKASYTDTGTSGNSIDPTELLYKGGQYVSAETMEQKDGTLFLGNLTVDTHKMLIAKNLLGGNVKLEVKTRTFYVSKNTNTDYPYSNQLTAYDDETLSNSVPCCGFKRGEWYRCGVQLQDTLGRWSDPIYVDDKQITSYVPRVDLNNSSKIHVPIIRGTITKETTESLINLGYKKVRPVVVFPSQKDRSVICQGVSCRTLYTENNKNKGIHAQSSWFFRTLVNKEEAITTVSSPSIGLEYIDGGFNNTNYNPGGAKAVEIQGFFDSNDKFKSRDDFYTLHSPELEFDDSILSVDFSGDNLYPASTGYVEFKRTLSDIQIQTETPTISNKGSGFVHKSFVSDGAKGIISGLFWDDFLVDDDTYRAEDSGIAQTFGVFNKDNENSPVKFMVYLWNKDGSLNNDINRPANMGTASAVLKKKIISNLRVAQTTLTCSQSGGDTAVGGEFSIKPCLFTDGEASVVKLQPTSKNSTIEGGIYQGNIDTILTPSDTDGMYFAFNENADALTKANIITSFEELPKWRTYHGEGHRHCLLHFDGSWIDKNYDALGDDYTELVMKKDLVRMKYKSTSHLVFGCSNNLGNSEDNKLSVIEIRKNIDKDQLFGGKSADALREHTWIPCGEPVSLDDYVIEEIEGAQQITFPVIESQEDSKPGGTNPKPLVTTDDIHKPEELKYKKIDEGGGEVPHEENHPGQVLPSLPTGRRAARRGYVEEGAYPDKQRYVQFYYKYGDTYFQRYDCLKTYAYTPEDKNQVVEIGSFMLETRVNIDGRYDRNRGQLSNLNMSPRNFNLLNPVYSQIDNFFSYKIMPDDTYGITKYPNQITWSKTKENGADVDLWTNITLASVLELDGDKGKVNKLIKFNNQLLCFQDTGVSQILYNENMQLSTTEGVPVEIANSGKVTGKRYLTDTKGCSNKWSVVSTPMGIYFIDSHARNINLFNGQLQCLSDLGGFNAWCKENMGMTAMKWNPTFPCSPMADFVACYDKQNQEVLFVNDETALAWNEKYQAFTSFYDYENSPFFVNLGNTGLWIKLKTEEVEDSGYQVEKEKYRYFSTLWKHHAGDYCRFFGENKPYSMLLVSNPEPQMDKIFTNVEFRACVDGDGTWETVTHEGKFTPFLPFDSLETWNEYQHGVALLKNMGGHEAFQHHKMNQNGSLKRKFRIWRCDVPRDQTENFDPFDETFDKTFHPRRFRYNDRMRNPWLYVKLVKDAAVDEEVNGEMVEHMLPKTEVHDVVMTYFV